MGTDRQNAANRRNALLSTGPVSQHGKETARRNALQHGMAGEGIVLPEHFALEAEEYNGQLNSSLKPWNTYELVLARHVARDLLRVDDCARRLNQRRCVLVHRARDHWDDDRRADAEILADGLTRRPLAVAARLRETKHGCELMIVHWKMLAAGLEVKGAWDAGQKAYALDLLGIPDGLRGGPTPLDPDHGGDPLAHLKATVAAQIDRLEARATGALADRDEQARYDAEIGGGFDDDPTIKLYRRYEAECSRRVARNRGLFQKTRRGESYEKIGCLDNDHVVRRVPEASPKPRPELNEGGSRKYFDDPIPEEIVTCVPAPIVDDLEVESWVEPQAAPQAEADSQAGDRPPDALRATA